MQPSEQLLTRKHLQGFGLSRYQSAAVTRGVVVVERRGSANVYRLPDLIGALRTYLERKIKKQTRVAVLVALDRLQAMLGNVVTPSFESEGDPDIRKALNELQGAIAEFDQASARLSARAALLEAKYGV